LAEASYGDFMTPKKRTPLVDSLSMRPYACLWERDVFGALVVAQAQVNRLTQFSVGRQFLIRDLRNQLRSQICDVALARRVHKRRRSHFATAKIDGDFGVKAIGLRLR
jgi:hypothetical protein